MRRKQEVCAEAAAVMFLFAVGLIETMPAVSFTLLGAMTIPALIGRLDKCRVSVRDIERRCRNVR